MAATGIATEVVKSIASTIIAGVVQQIKDVVELEENFQLLQTDFTRMEVFLRYIDDRFQEQQRRLPEPVELCLTRMNNALTQAKQLVERAKRQRRRCFGCCLLCSPKLTTEVRNWETRFGQHFEDLQHDFSITANAEHIVSTAAPQAEVLRQDVPDDIVGSAIGSAQVKLQTWLTEPAHNQSRVIGIFGMGGVGKTSVLKVIHDNYKKVSGIFDIVIWFTVSKYKPEEENDKIKELQASIAYTLHVDLKDCPTLDIQKMKLSASLEKKRFLLILDDLWSKMDLVKVGVKFGRDKGSKVLISTRSRDVIKNMEASDYSLRMEPLSQEDGWKLFSRKAFANWATQEKDIQIIAEEIAKECKGLPLALNVVAAALSSERDPNKWRDALAFMRNVDPSFPDTHSTIDAELYHRLRWSYNDLSDTLKSCFLYCAAFPEDAEIDVETLVEMWSAEGLFKWRGISSLMDVGRQYIDALVGRCLIEYVGVKRINIPYSDGWRRVEKEVIKVHDVLRDTAIYIGERDEHWVFASGQHLQNFPREEVTRNCKRLSVTRNCNDIEELPTDLECTELLSLILANCPKLRKVPAASFLNIMSLKVLDLSCTLITSLPTSVGQLGQLEFLNLTGCYRLNKLPETICSLFRLQFLNLDYCESLESLPDNIGDLKSLKHFSLESTGTRSMVIPRSIFGLTSLTKLCLPRWSPGCAISMEDLINLSNLMELRIAVKAHTMSNCDWTWLKMRKLALGFVYDGDEDEDDVVEDAVMLDTLPLENMNELQSLSLILYRGLSLPNYICKFQNLEELELAHCPELRELPVLEIGSDSASGSFPMLKKLGLLYLDKLESITSVLNGGAMSKLQYLKIGSCPLLNILPIGIEKLCNLKEISGGKYWWSDIIWEDEATRVKLQPLFREWFGE